MRPAEREGGQEMAESALAQVGTERLLGHGWSAIREVRSNNHETDLRDCTGPSRRTIQ